MKDSTFFDGALDAHLKAENDHNIAAIMKTFADTSEVVWGGRVFRGHNAIRKLHEGMGFGETGAFSGLEVIERKRHRLGTTIIVEQTVKGRHTGTWEELPASGRTFEVPVCTVYEFDAEGVLISERPYLDRSLIAKQIRAA